MTEIDAIKRRYNDLRRIYLNRDIDATTYLQMKYKIDDDFERIMKRIDERQK